ncbi:MAG: hypothetical protein LBB21_04225 [Holosporaceae bacterium]|jgi:hypothetical protein|nr:hypothetical protein [Holosporaceae bacterium]
MKKIVLSMMFVALQFNVHAADAESEHNNVNVEREEKQQYEGFYFGLGAHIASVGEKVLYTYSNGVKTMEVGHNTVRLGGTVTAGLGKRLPKVPVYGSIEIGCDVGPVAEKIEADKGTASDVANAVKYYSQRTETNGISPYVALRLGAVHHKLGGLFYVKVGAAHEKSMEHYNGYIQNAPDPATDSELEVSKFRPIVALGVEKSYGKNLTGRTEIECRFGGSKTKKWERGDEVKLTQKDRVTFRAFVCYHGKIGKLWDEVL